MKRLLRPHTRQGCIGEVRPSMAAHTLLVREQRLAPLRLIRNRPGIPPTIPVIWRIQRHQRPLERRKRQRDRIHIDLAAALGKRRREQFRITRLILQPLRQRPFRSPRKSHLHRHKPLDRDQRLMLQRVDLRPAPGQRPEPPHIRQRLDVALARLPVETCACLVGICKATLLLMAGRAGHGPVPRQIAIIEQPPPQLDFDRRRRIVRREGRHGIHRDPRLANRSGRHTRARHNSGKRRSAERRQTQSPCHAQGFLATITRSVSAPLPAICSTCTPGFSAKVTILRIVVHSGP